jgi:hypothetical protein
MANEEGMTKSKPAGDDYEEAFWNDGITPVVREQPIPRRSYDLEERTAQFCEAIIDLAKAIPQNAVTNRIMLVQRQVWGQITLKPTMRCRKKSF